jgi:SAM-dependent methyltransferase
MTLTYKEKQTVDYYDRKAPDWTAAHGGYKGASYWTTEMARFHELLPSGKVLEIGSGAGKDAAALLAMGYDYTGTDASAGLINVAQKRNPQAKFICQAVHDLDFPEGNFDGFWTAATLLHIPKDKIGSALEKIKSNMKVDGIGFISVIQGEGERTDPDTGRLFSYYSEDEFANVLKTNGYEVVESKVRAGEKDTWLIYFVRT